MTAQVGLPPKDILAHRSSSSQWGIGTNDCQWREAVRGNIGGDDDAPGAIKFHFQYPPFEVLKGRSSKSWKQDLLRFKNYTSVRQF
jgi:hypothetical protein